MKIMICTTPIRPVPTDYPPFGSLAVIQALRDAGYDSVFYDIDALRPSREEVVEHFRREAPDVIGISAVVSTAYAYVKWLGPAIRKILPNTRIVLGGNLAASSELLHRFCGIDLCVIGEGERIIVELVNHFANHPGPLDPKRLSAIKGITFLDESNHVEFTDYQVAIPAADLFTPDFSILEKFSNINNYITDPLTRRDFAGDPRAYEPHRRGKKMSVVVSAKGCVARCTFCHRWDKGFRQIPPQKIVDRIKYLIDRYNVGFIIFGDENFGSDRRATEELIRLIKPLDVLWEVGGVRARSVDLDLLQRMKDAGCVALYFGFETGSVGMLGVMEKNLKLEHNLNAARWTHEAALSTIYQLVLAMPGETDDTVAETTEMVKKITEFLPESPHKYLSINYIQALPGTPVYEHARSQGLLGATPQGEERHLLAISDVDAADDTTFLNFTNEPYLKVRSWRFKMVYEAVVHWWRTRDARPQTVTVSTRDHKEYNKGGYFNLQSIAHHPGLLARLYPLRSVLVWSATLSSELKNSPFPVFASRVWELVTWRWTHRKRAADYRSLRVVMKDAAAPPATKTEENMLPLRLGR